MTDLESLLILNSISQLGSIRIKKLLEHFGETKKILLATQKELCAVEGISLAVAQNIVSRKNKLDIKKELDLADKNGIKIISIQDKDYPENLKNIYDPPIILYIKGRLLEKDIFSIAIVGSRRASIYGISTAEKFAFELAQLGITIVSGMARGIDSAAHRGSLKSKGRTIAVLGSGLLNIYPPENKELFQEICENGCVISEFPLETKPLAENFPRRNRIISGLSLGLIVVEASRNSGALISANLALEQGREVFAVPGKVDSVNSFGVHTLIKQGAKLTASIDDVLTELKPHLTGLIKSSKKSQQEFSPKPNLELNKEETIVCELINEDAKYIDEIVEMSNLSVTKVMSILTNLELRHIVKQLPGKLFVRKSNV
ncbi:MAG: DNA-processing protein DprA [Candidatus Omnitrophota bacterium]|nr:DNA-processing protein DprA [Candidatus Omnitrophota bacterium]